MVYCSVMRTRSTTEEEVPPLHRVRAHRIDIDRDTAPIADHLSSRDDHVVHGSTVGCPHQLQHRISAARHELWSAGVVHDDVSLLADLDRTNPVAEADRACAADR